MLTDTPTVEERVVALVDEAGGRVVVDESNPAHDVFLHVTLMDRSRLANLQGIILRLDMTTRHVVEATRRSPAEIPQMPAKPAKNYDDIPIMPKPDGDKDMCPVCAGHGKWNLRLNAYGPGKHFQGGCNACWGWGWIDKGTCAHVYDARPTKEDMERVPARGSCGSHWKCSKCGEVVWVDSSD